MHSSLSLYLLRFLQYFPTMCIPCIILYRNCCMSGLIVFFLVFIHITLLVSSLPVTHCMAVWVSCMFFLVVFLGSDWFCSRISLYTVACVRDGSFAPVMSNSSGISRFKGSGCCLFAPSFASALLPSLPWTPLCPFTHCRVVLADLYLIKCAAFLNSLAFFMPIHPSFSQVSRWVIKPSMTYLESVQILTGW